jgi:tripartite-type tricarboxylate transporter receptor subunit TctC
MLKLFSSAIVAALTTMIFVAPNVVLAQEYPTRTVHIIVAQPPGGGTDTIARLVAEQLSKQLGQPFIIENRPGAGFVVGTEFAARATPDGYTLVIGLNGNMAVNPSLFSNLHYDPVRDFSPVAMLADFPFLVVVNNDLPARTMKELVDLAKAKPGEINYASAGNGTGQQLAMELFKMVTGTNFTHIPYRGAQAAYIDIMSGKVAVMFDNISTAIGQVKGGKVRALAVTTRERVQVLPDLNTVAESGISGYEYQTWFGLWAPRNTPRPIIEKLHSEIVKALASPVLKSHIEVLGGIPATMALADIEPFVKAEIIKWAEVVKHAGIKVVD